MTVEELYNILEKEVDSGNLDLDSPVCIEQSGEIKEYLTDENVRFIDGKLIKYLELRL
jgi:hypothetical protein